MFNDNCRILQDEIYFINAKHFLVFDHQLLLSLSPAHTNPPSARFTARTKHLFYLCVVLGKIASTQ